MGDAGGSGGGWGNGYWDDVKVWSVTDTQEVIHQGQNATCDVNFYLDAVAPENLIGTVNNVFVPADGQATVGIDWTAVAGEHQIIVNIANVSPQDSDLTNNQASKPISVAPAAVPGALEITKVKLSGVDEGYTQTYYEWVLQINITNSGGSLLRDVCVRDTLPAELALLSLSPTTGTASYYCSDPSGGTRSMAPQPEVGPTKKATHIEWLVGELQPGQTEILTMTICTTVNPAGKQEFTSPGTYSLNNGAWAEGYDTLTGAIISAGPTPQITVSITLAPLKTAPIVTHLPTPSPPPIRSHMI